MLTKKFGDAVGSWSEIYSSKFARFRTGVLRVFLLRTIVNAEDTRLESEQSQDVNKTSGSG